MRVHFHGAAGQVTGSMHLVEAAGKRVLLDCGLQQGSQELEAANADPFPFDAASIDAVTSNCVINLVPDKPAVFREIARVLRPGGLAWISEPVYAGELNEIMRLFHDEKLVRQAAFAAVCRAVESGRLRLRDELFFSTRSHFADFAQFDARMIRVTHSQHALSPELYREVEERFSAHLTPNGVTLLSPQRVDLLEKPR